MIKSMLKRMVNSFCYSIAITTLLYFVMLKVANQMPMLSEYAAKFDNDVTALVVQLLLIGLMSASLAGGTVIMEIERLGLLVQSIVYFVISSAVWISVASYCWGLGKYIQSAVSLILSYSVSYAICWIIQYKTCKKNIDEINLRLKKLGQAE